jgi:hypothetical protein
MLPYKPAGCQDTVPWPVRQESRDTAPGGAGSRGHEAKVDTTQETPRHGEWGERGNEAKVLQRWKQQNGRKGEKEI